jgi:two-component system sensor histidine kinase FlrB
MCPQQPARKQELEDAFAVFNQLSAELADSYRTLEQRTERLTAELAEARTERSRQLAEKERLATRLQNLLNALPAGVVVIDGGGRVQDCNPAARDLLGEPLAGAAWRDVIDRAFAPRSDDGHDVSLCDGRRVNISTCPLGSEPGQILLLHDVTETRAMQARLSRHVRLSAMGEVVAKLAHQIRTPLAAALLYVSHLTRPQLEFEERRRLAEKILGRLRHLEGMVSDMLAFARGGGSGAHEFSVGELLEQVRCTVEPLLAAGGCRMEIVDAAVDARLRGNREAVSGALQNLVANAIQACGRGGRIVLESAANGDRLRLMVHDNGPGIPVELRERIFEPFFTTRNEGTGLGLAVVQAVARAHDGVACVDAGPGGGSTFALELPVSQSSDGVATGGEPSIKSQANCELGQ